MQTYTKTGKIKSNCIFDYVLLFFLSLVQFGTERTKCTPQFIDRKFLIHVKVPQCAFMHMLLFDYLKISHQKIKIPNQGTILQSDLVPLNAV